MSKSIERCSKCGGNVNFLFYIMRIKGVNLEFYEYIKRYMCKECADKFVKKYIKYANNQKRGDYND